MDKNWFQLGATAFLLLAAPTVVVAQEMQPVQNTGLAQNTAPVQNTPTYTQQQIDQMLAPIALYPDPLIAQILMASTYPLEVVEAQRWLQDPQNASLKGDQLAAALTQQPWDPSVKSLVPFPQILQTMDKNLGWTEQLGDAFLANQPAVMDSVQRLRAQARAAGTLKTTSQQVVTTQGQAIEIQPANPQVVYVPYYNPVSVYGAWPYPGYPPFYFAPPPGYAYDGMFIGFGLGLAIIGPFWGWDHWDWGHHRIDIDGDRFAHINNGHPAMGGGRQWQHDPGHRHGVPYHSAATRGQFQHASEESRRSARGYNAVATAQATHNAVAAAQATHSTAGAVSEQHAATRGTNTTVAGREHGVAAREHGSVPDASSAARGSMQPSAQGASSAHASAPLFESLSHGATARTHAARGASSRSVAVNHAAVSHAVVSHASGAPSGGGHSDRNERR